MDISFTSGLELPVNLGVAPWCKSIPYNIEIVPARSVIWNVESRYVGSEWLESPLIFVFKLDGNHRIWKQINEIVDLYSNPMVSIEFEGKKPFQIQSPESALKIPLICHIGFAKWPTWWCFTKKNVKKNLKMEKSTFWTPRSKLASLRAKKGPKSLLKAIFHVSILPLDDSGGFWPKFWDQRKKLYIWAGITHMQFWPSVQ